MNLWYMNGLDEREHFYMLSLSEIDAEINGSVYFDERLYKRKLDEYNGKYPLNDDLKKRIKENVRDGRKPFVDDYPISFFKDNDYSLLDLAQPDSSSKFGKNFRIENKDEEVMIEMIGKVNKELVTKLLTISNKNNPVKEEYVDWYLNEWAKAKYEYYILLGREFTYKKPVEIIMSDDEIRFAVNEVGKGYEGEKRIILTTFRPDEWRNNRIGLNHYVDKNIVGMKVTKYLSRKFQDPKYDIDISTILQNMKKKGNVVVSIDPVDYLTMAVVDSAHKWFSCYNITPGSGWSCCPTSLMVDESSIVVYRDNGKTYDYDINGIKFSWNSKQVRLIVFVDKGTSSIIFTTPTGNPSNKFKEQMEEIVVKSLRPDLDIIYKTANKSAINVEKTRGYHHFGDDLDKIYVPYQLANHLVQFNIGDRQLICPSNGEMVPFDQKDTLYRPKKGE